MCASVVFLESPSFEQHKCRMGKGLNCNMVYWNKTILVGGSSPHPHPHHQEKVIAYPHGLVSRVQMIWIYHVTLQMDAFFLEKEIHYEYSSL